MSSPGPSRSTDWRDRWAAFRNRLVADPRFQRLAADLPLVRRVAAGHADALFDLCAGFVYSQVLLAAVRSRMLDVLADEPLGPGELARATDLPEASARTLAEAAVALGLVETRSGGRYGLAVGGAALRGTPGLVDMVEHHATVYADLADPLALLRSGRGAEGLAGFWPYAGSGAAPDAAAAARYSRLMSATQGFISEDVLDAVDLSRHRLAIDVGGGDGAFLASLGRRYPGLALRLFDLAPVAVLAEERFAREGFGGRAEAVAGDFRCDPLPGGADLVTFVRVLHDHDDATVRRVLSLARDALAPGGRVLIAEPLAGTPGSPRMGAAYFGFYLMAMGRGRPRTVDELRAHLAEAGFVRPRSVRTRRPMLVSVVTAERG